MTSTDRTELRRQLIEVHRKLVALRMANGPDLREEEVLLQEVERLEQALQRAVEEEREA